LDRERILAALRERIVAYAASRVGRDQAEDLAQEVLLVLERKYAEVAPMEELMPLAFQILRFQMTGWRRKAARRGEYNQVAVQDVPLADLGEDPETRAGRIEMRERLEAAMAKMEDRCRELFRLKLEGNSFGEIQERMGAGSINTIYTWDSRCRRRLLELMGGSWR